MKALICPQCGANIDLDDTREFGFCTYCGAKIQLVEKVCVEHTGSASINCSPIVENLCKKGFISIDRGDFSAAAKDFEKASEYDCEDTAVIIGKMLVSADDYYNLLKRKYPEISECEKNFINSNNCKLFFLCYLNYDDKERVDYVLERFPEVLSLEVLNCGFEKKDRLIGNTYRNSIHINYREKVSKILEKGRKTDIIEYLLKAGFTPTEIFNCLHLNAYNLEHSSKSEGKDIYYMYEYHLSVIPLHVFHRLLTEGLTTNTKVLFLKPYNDDGYIKHVEKEITLCDFLSRSMYTRHINYIDANAPSKEERYKEIERVVPKNDSFKEESKAAYENVKKRSAIDREIKNPNIRYLNAINEVYPDTVPKKSGCYIATCVYGSYDCPQVWTLRRFRDSVLVKTWYGKLFILLYYTISPKIVKTFGNTEWFKKLWIGLLNKIVNSLNQKGFSDNQYYDI